MNGAPDGDGGADGRGPAAAELTPVRTVIADMVHDLRNPLAALAGNLALLREELAGQALSRIGQQSLDDAAALAERALAIVTTIADVDALEAGTIVASRRPTQLRAVVDEALATIRADVAARGLHVAVAIDGGLIADVDGRLIGRLVQNLLDNAARQAPRGGHIAIAAAHEAGALVLTVGNDGPPLTPAEQAAIFAPDFRLAERRASTRRGRALGMYFCRLVAQAHRGTLAIAGAPLPATFVLRCPA